MVGLLGGAFGRAHASGLRTIVPGSQEVSSHWLLPSAGRHAENASVVELNTDDETAAVRRWWYKNITVYMGDLEEVEYCVFGGEPVSRQPLTYSSYGLRDRNSPPAQGQRSVTLRSWRNEICCLDYGSLVEGCLAMARDKRGSTCKLRRWRSVEEAISRALWRYGLSCSTFCLAAYGGRGWWTPPLCLINDLSLAGVDYALETIHCAALVCGRSRHLLGDEISVVQLTAVVTTVANNLHWAGSAACFPVTCLRPDADEEWCGVDRDEVAWAVHVATIARSANLYNGLANSICTAMLACGQGRVNEVVALHLLSMLDRNSHAPPQLIAASETIDFRTGRLDRPVWGLLENWAATLLGAKLSGNEEAYLQGGVGRIFLPCLSALLPIWIMPELSLDMGYTLQPQFDADGGPVGTYKVAWGHGDSMVMLRNVAKGTNPLENCSGWQQVGCARYMDAWTACNSTMVCGDLSMPIAVATNHGCVGTACSMPLAPLFRRLGIDTLYMSGMDIAIYRGGLRASRWWSPMIADLTALGTSAVLCPIGGFSLCETAGFYEALATEGLDRVLTICTRSPIMCLALGALSLRSLRALEAALPRGSARPGESYRARTGVGVIVVPNDSVTGAIKTALAVSRMVCLLNGSVVTDIVDHERTLDGSCSFAGFREITSDVRYATLLDPSGSYTLEHAQKWGGVCELIIGNSGVPLVALLTFPELSHAHLGGWMIFNSTGGEYNRGHCTIFAGTAPPHDITMPCCPGQLRLGGGRQRATRPIAFDVCKWRTLPWKTRHRAPDIILLRRNSHRVKHRIADQMLRKELEVILFGQEGLRVAVKRSIALSCSSGEWSARVSVLVHLMTSDRVRDVWAGPARVERPLPDHLALHSRTASTLAKTTSVPEVVAFTARSADSYDPNWCSWCDDFEIARLLGPGGRRIFRVWTRHSKQAWHAFITCQR